ncbi:MAG TPA: hypothetical protein VF054_20755 [Micromonosporaceae bacterium]
MDRTAHSHHPGDADRAARGRRPGYARLLRLRHIQPGGLACFLLFEGTLTVAALLALAELTDPWSLLLLPTAVAVMVKYHDVVAGLLAPPPAVSVPVAAGPHLPLRALGRAPVVGAARGTCALPRGRARGERGRSAFDRGRSGQRRGRGTERRLAVVRSYGSL